MRDQFATDNPDFFVPSNLDLALNYRAPGSESKDNKCAFLRSGGVKSIPKFWRARRTDPRPWVDDGMYIRLQDPVPNKGDLFVPNWLTRASDDAKLTEILINRFLRYWNGREIVGDLNGSKMLGTCLVPVMRKVMESPLEGSETRLFFIYLRDFDDEHNQDQQQDYGYGFLIILESTKELLWFHPTVEGWGQDIEVNYEPYVFLLGVVEEFIYVPGKRGGRARQRAEWQVNEFAQHVALNMF